MQTTAPARPVVGVTLVLALLANLAGYHWPLYQRWDWFDKVLHGYSIFTLTLLPAVFLAGRVLTGRRAHPLLLVLTIASVGLAIGALWEVAEWGFDLFAPGNVIKGKPDTITDLIADTVGALAAGGLTLSLTRPAGPAER